MQLPEHRVMNQNISLLKVGCLQLPSKRQRNLATEALPNGQLAVKFPKLHNQVADEPTSSLISFGAQAVKLLLRNRNWLQLATHQIQKMNSTSLVPQKQITKRSHHHRRKLSRN
jgi:hypothetical protein